MVLSLTKKMGCKVNVYDSAVIWIMMKAKPKSGPKKAQARLVMVPSKDEISMTHYFITDLSDYGGHRLVKKDNTYWTQYNLHMYPMFDWSEVESGKFDYEFKEYTCSDPESIYGLNGTLYSGNLYWGTFYFENKTDRLNATHYFGWQATLSSLVDHVPSGYNYHSVYWNANFKEGSVVPKSGFKVNVVVSGATDGVYEGDLVVATSGETKDYSLYNNLSSDFRRGLVSESRKFDYVFDGYEIESGNGVLSDATSEKSTFDPDDGVAIIKAKYIAKMRSMITLNTFVDDELVGETVVYKSSSVNFSLADSIDKSNFDTIKYTYAFDKYVIITGNINAVDLVDINTDFFLSGIENDIEINAYFSIESNKTLQVNVKFSDSDFSMIHEGTIHSLPDTEFVFVADYIDEYKASELFKSFESYYFTGMNITYPDGSTVTNADMSKPIDLSYGRTVVLLKCDIRLQSSSSGINYLKYNYDAMKNAIVRAGQDVGIADDYLNHYEVAPVLDNHRGSLWVSQVKKIAKDNVINIAFPHFVVSGYYFIGEYTSYHDLSSITCSFDGVLSKDVSDSDYLYYDDRVIDVYASGTWYPPYTYNFYTKIYDDSHVDLILVSEPKQIVIYNDDIKSNIRLYDYVDHDLLDEDLCNYNFMSYNVTNFDSSVSRYIITDELTGVFRSAFVGECEFNSGVYMHGYDKSSSDLTASYKAIPKANRVTVTTSVSGNQIKESSKSKLFNVRRVSDIGTLVDKSLINDMDSTIVFDGYEIVKGADLAYIYDPSDIHTDLMCSGLNALGNNIEVLAKYRMYTEAKLSYDLNGFGGSNGSSGGNNNAQNAKSTQDQKSDHVVSAVRTADAEYMMFIIIFSVGAIALGYLICRKTGLLAGRDE